MVVVGGSQSVLGGNKFFLKYKKGGNYFFEKVLLITDMSIC